MLPLHESKKKISQNENLKKNAAQYHFKNVLKFLNEDNLLKVSGTVELAAIHYVYEFLLSKLLQQSKREGKYKKSYI